MHKHSYHYNQNDGDGYVLSKNRQSVRKAHS